MNSKCSCVKSRREGDVMVMSARVADCFSVNASDSFWILFLRCFIYNVDHTSRDVLRHHATVGVASYILCHSLCDVASQGVGSCGPNLTEPKTVSVRKQTATWRGNVECRLLW